MEEFVKLKDITKVYHMGEVEIRAADNINFSIKKGEFVVIVGPSGAGKTTVLNILGGMDTATGGTLTVDGKDITAYDSRQLTGYRRDDIGFVFQFYNLIPTLTVHENVKLVDEIVKNSLSSTKMLEEVGLSDHLKNFPAELSGGEQQRVSIARALAKKYNVSMPIVEQVNEVLFEGKPAKEAVADLMLRDKRIEHSDLPWE